MDPTLTRRDSGRDNEEARPRSPAAQPALLKTRIPQSRDSPAGNTSPCLSILGSEVLSIVMDLVQQESPKSLSSIALVNSAFYHLARYSQFRDLSVNVGTGHQVRSLSIYIENAGLLPAVRELRISGQSAEAGDSGLSQVADFIKKLTGLTDLIWHSPQVISATVLQHLEERPSLRLHTRYLSLTPRPGHEPVDTTDHGLLVKLQTCTNLHSLEVVQEFYAPQQALAINKSLKQILLSCPNLRRLKIDIGTPLFKYVTPARFREYCGLGFLDGERPLAALEELDLIRYPFGMPQPVENPDPSQPNISERPWYWDGYPLRVHEEDYWAKNFDWSHIKRLVAPPSLKVKMMPYLTSVSEMNMEDVSVSDFQEFYEQLPPTLETITVPRLGDVGVEPILRLGSGLRKLTIHQTQKNNWASQAVSLDDLQAIRNSCPFIEQLGIDLARSMAWPYEVFDVLASFPELRRLELWFEVGVENKRIPALPHTTFHASQEIARYLLAKSARSPPCLHSIWIHSGNSSPSYVSHRESVDNWQVQLHELHVQVVRPR